MSPATKPTAKPKCGNFSSGPCAKPPAWKVENLSGALVGRSHRSKEGKAQLKDAIERTKKILGVPEDYLCGVMPASDTGAFECAMWSLLGQRPADVFAWESFGNGWLTDIAKQLKIEHRAFKADYGKLPDLSQVDPSHDVVFCFNGTTSGVRVPNGDWIPDNMQGLVLCDATSAVFAMDLPWKKLDVVTFSWQKVLGGEAAHGMLILSPKAVKALGEHTPPWPMPKIFRLTKGSDLIKGIFEGATINTPSMICVLDYLNALDWAESVGGLKGLMERSQGNLKAVEDWAAKTAWVDFLAETPETRSCTSVCLKIVDPKFTGLDAAKQKELIGKMVSLLGAQEKVAYDVGAYRDAPPGIRIWCGATVEKSDVEALLPWLDYAYAEVCG